MLTLSVSVTASGWCIYRFAACWTHNVVIVQEKVASILDDIASNDQDTNVFITRNKIQIVILTEMLQGTYLF